MGLSQPMPAVRNSVVYCVRVGRTVTGTLLAERCVRRQLLWCSQLLGGETRSRASTEKADEESGRGYLSFVLY